MKTERGLVLGVILLVSMSLSTGRVQAAGSSMPIVFSGYTNRTEALTNFPVLVVLSNNVGNSGFTYAGFFSANGWDLRFRDGADTTNLNYEIERWDTNGASHVWVQVPVLASNGMTSILARWGDAADTNQLACTTNGAVWHASFKAVWHLPGLTAAADSTTNRNNGTTYNGATATNGVADGAVGFDGSNDYMKTDANFKLGGIQKLTVSCWFKQTTFADDDRFLMELSPNANTSPDGSFFVIPNGSGGGTSLGAGKINIGLYGAGPKYCIAALARPSAGAWHHYSFVFDRSSAFPQIKAVFLDGAAQSLSYDTKNTQLSAGTFFRDDILYLMSRAGTSLYDAGSLDEFRVAATLQSADWVWAEYQTMAANGQFTTYGAVVTPNTDTVVIRNVAATSITGSGADLVGELQQGLAPVEVTCYWGTNDGMVNAAAWMTNTWLGTNSLGYLTNNLTGLQAGTRYYFRFYATNGVSTAWAGSSQSPSPCFSTRGAPTVDNGSGAGAVGPTFATLNGTVVAGNPSPDVWIYWGTSEGSTNDKASWNLPAISFGQPGLAGFSSGQTGLQANQTYWYRCYASNVYGEAWAPAGTAFTTAAPSIAVAPAATNVAEGAAATTNAAVLTVTLSAASAVPVTVNYTTSNGTATVADNDYVASSGVLTIPAGVVSTQLAVQVVGDNRYEADETFTVTLRNPDGATLGTPSQSTVTIQNDDYTFYVRHGGAGATNGFDWANAFDTLQKALNAAPINQGITINVQASTGTQTYAPCVRLSTSGSLLVNFQGGWTNVDVAPAQGGLSAIASSEPTQDGISVNTAYSYHLVYLTVNGFSISNVVKGISLSATEYHSGCVLAVSNTTVRAQDHGVLVSYGRGPAAGGGPCQVTAANVDIAAGLCGTNGDGFYASGTWQGSSVTACGIDPASGVPRVSSVASAGGCGVRLVNAQGGNGAHDVLFSNVVFHGCASNGVLLAAVPNDTVQARVHHCTLADNLGAGLAIVAGGAGSVAAVTNTIFANNGAAGVDLGASGGPAMSCREAFNVFYHDTILTNGVAQPVHASTSAGDPVFYGRKTSPAPWYWLGSRASPAYHSASDGLNRGAYQAEKVVTGMAVFFL